MRSYFVLSIGVRSYFVLSIAVRSYFVLSISVRSYFVLSIGVRSYFVLSWEAQINSRGLKSIVALQQKLHEIRNPLHSPTMSYLQGIYKVSVNILTDNMTNRLLFQ